MENSMEASEKTNENSQISFAFIDKTPSKDSLATVQRGNILASKSESL
jgi:hypothetical protein